MQTKELNIGAKVTGIVTEACNDMVKIDLGTKHTGYIPTMEFRKRRRTLPRMDDAVKAYIVRIDDAQCRIRLSLDSPELQEWSGWKAWKANINEHSAVIAMLFLKELCEEYNAVLAKAREKYETEKQKISKRNDAKLAAITQKQNAAVNDCKAAYERALRENAQREKEAYETCGADFDACCGSNATDGYFRKIIDKLRGGQNAAMEGQTGSAVRKKAEHRASLEKAFEENRERLRLRYQENVRQAKASAELAGAEEAERYQKEKKSLQDAFTRETAAADRRFSAVLEDVMSKKDIEAYVSMAQSSIPAYDGYTCSDRIPAYVCLGHVKLEVARKAKLLPEVLRTVSKEAAQALDRPASGTITAKLPYCQRLDEGVSLFLNYSAKDRVRYQDQLRMLLLKLFMAFPAGKLEATMIDPLELGETFAMFAKLGEEKPRIIDTKVWSQEKDISEAIHILRQKLETMTQAYGNDKAARLKKEPVRVLAITDFPTGFNQNALRDLQAIVRKSASYGVCVFIWANAEEIRKLQASRQSVFHEIGQMLHAASATGTGALKLETGKEQDVFLELDPLSASGGHENTIISTLVKGIHHFRDKVEKFEDLYHGIGDPVNWFRENTIDEFSIPIGIKGADTIVKLVVGRTDGSTEHHVLIAGQTGAGKSTLLHTIIMGTLLNYSPEEAQLYLVDFKEGVEFKTYSRLNLPSIRVIAIDCEREFGLAVLTELQKEMKNRYARFKREADCEEISDYRKATGKKLPKLLVVFDEVQELFRGAGEDPVAKKCETLLGELLTLGRAAGIHIILASQNFNLLPSVKPTLFAHAAIRIALKGSEDSARSVLGDGNSGTRQFQKGTTGAAVYNSASGRESDNVFFQVGYLGNDRRAEYLKRLSTLQNGEAFAGACENKTRVLLTCAEDDIFNVFNRLIINGQVPPLEDDRYWLTVGDGFGMHKNLKIGIAPKAGQNLLMIGSDEKRAAGMFCLSILSLLCCDLGNADHGKEEPLIHLIDLSAEAEDPDSGGTDLKHMETLFRGQVKRAAMCDMEAAICTVYDTLLRRMDGAESSDRRLFLLFFGINRAHRLMRGNMYEEDAGGQMSALQKLNGIMGHGAGYGIHCIFWGENLTGTAKIMGASIERDFAQRIVFSSDAAAMEQLVMENNGDSLKPTTAVYMNVDDDIKNTHFRPYEIPAKAWVEELAEAYRSFG